MKKIKIKTTSVVVCALLMIAAVSGISILTDQGVFDTAEAADTGAKPIIGLAPVGSVLEVDQVDLIDIAWNSAGTIAVAVGVRFVDPNFIGAAYRFEARTEEWFKLTHNDENELYGVAWCDATHGGSFIVVGDGTDVGFSSVGYTDGYAGLQPFYDGLNGETMRGVATNNVDPKPLVVGNGGAYYYDGTTWQHIGNLASGDNYKDVVYTNGFYYIVGDREIDFEYRGVFYRLADGGLNAQYISPPNYYDPAGLDVFMFDFHGVDARGDNVILVGTNILDVYNAGNYKGKPVHLDDPIEYIFRDVAWVDDKVAYLVGHDFSLNGFFYQYNIDLHKVSELPGSSGIGNAQHGIARTDSSPMIISVGEFASDSAWQISQTSGFSDIIVNTYYPHILSVEMFEVGQPGNRLNTQIDVNADGQMDRVYELRVVVRHEVQDILDIVGFSAWHDGGVIGDGSAHPVEDDSSRTQAFRVGWDRNALAGDEFTWYWPTIDGDQMEVIPGIHEYIEQSGADFDQFEISFRFIPGPQMRFANGIGGAFNPNNNPYNKNDALTTPNTWDIEVHATDSQGGFNHSYDEFGVYRFTSLTVQGLPGAYSASAAPGMTDVLLSPGGSTNLTYSANCEHAIKVYLETDLIGQDTGISIPANNMHVQGGEQIKIPFNGSGEINSRYLIGNGFDIWNTPRNRFNYTTTAIGTNDELGTLHPQIEWWVDIPGGIPEDSYRTNIVYVLEHSG